MFNFVIYEFGTLLEEMTRGITLVAACAAADRSGPQCSRLTASGTPQPLPPAPTTSPWRALEFVPEELSRSGQKGMHAWELRKPAAILT